MTDRVCHHCGEAEVRREHRAPWMKTMAYILPLRPQVCASCDARSWTLLQHGDGIAPWISSVAIWGIGLLMLWGVIRGPQSDTSAPADSPVVERRSIPASTPLPSALPMAIPTAIPTVTPSPNPTAEPTAAAESTAKPAASAVPAKAAKGKLNLSSAEAAVKDGLVEIVLETDAGNLKYSLTKSRYIKGYVLDLPGIWTLARGVKSSRDFSQTNLKQLRVEQHDKFLRVVLQVRDNSGAAPVIDRQGGRLRIEVR